MWQALVATGRRWLDDLRRAINRPRGPAQAPWPRPSNDAVSYRRLQGVRLTDGTARTLFEGYAAHRAEEARGEEETGWLLLGLREADAAIVLATLPAGAQRDASSTHVRFNAAAQAVASRAVRQNDRRLTIVGVVHTHPGSLRHPSDGDYRGDCEWVRRLRGKEGVFAIGTADGRHDQMYASQPRPHVQSLGELNFSWYALGEGDGHYRPLPVSVTLGPDLARPLHSVWEVIEEHAEEIERLFRQQAGVSLSVQDGLSGPALQVTVPLAESGAWVRAVARSKGVRYTVRRGDEEAVADCGEARLDRGVYLLMADLAARM